MKANNTNLATGLALAFILGGVVAASVLRVQLFAPQPAFAQQEANVSDASLITAGKALFDAQCSSCHATDTTAGKYAPGFKGLGKAGKLPTSGRPATEQHIRDQLKKPFKTMPPFDKLSDQEVRSLAAYLLSL